MLKAIAFGLSAGAAVQAWRNFPADGPVLMESAVLVSIGAVVCAFLGGLWHGRGRASASATAVASAEASAASQSAASVQFIQVMPGQGARPVGVGMPTEAAPWVTGEQRPQISADDLDGFDLSELGEHHELHDGTG